MHKEPESIKGDSQGGRPGGISMKSRLVTAVIVVVAGLVIVSAIMAPAFRDPYNYGWGDWQVYAQFDQAPVTAMKHFGQIMLWSPYTNGGIPYISSSSPNYLSPFFILKVIFGVALGTKIVISLQLLLGFVFMYLLARDLQMGRMLSLLPSALFTASAMIVVHISGGHLWACPFLYYPAIILSYRLCFRNPAWIALGAFFIALTLFEGGIYPFPFLIILFSLYTISACFGGFPMDGPLHLKPDCRPVLFTFVMFAAGIMLAAPKLIPQMLYLRENPREIFNYDQIPFSLAWDVFTSRHSTFHWDRLSFQNYKWWGEYTQFIGEIGVLLAGATILLRFRKYAVHAIFCLIFFLLMLGNHGSWSPYELLRNLPFYSNLRVPTRFGFLVAFHAGFLAAYGIRDLALHVRKIRTPMLRYGITHVLLPVIAVAFAADVTYQNAQWMYSRFRIPERGNPDAPIEEFRQVHSGGHGSYIHIRRNIGAVNGYEPNPIPRSRNLRIGKVPQYWLKVPGSGSVKQTYWSPNRLEFSADLEEAGTLVINQNHYTGWHSSVGEITSQGGLLAVKLPDGRNEVSVYFWPPGLTMGLILSIIALIIVIAIVIWGKKLPLREPDVKPVAFSRKGAFAIAAGGPPLLVVAVLAASALFQPSYDELMTDAEEYLSEHWKKGDVLLHYPECIGPSCKQFSKFQTAGWRAVVRPDNLKNRRLWILYNRPNYDPHGPDKLKRLYRVLQSRDFGYLELTLLVTKDGDRDK